MIDLADIINQYHSEFFSKYKDKISPQQQWALSSIANCQKSSHLEMVLKCNDCGAYETRPHSCGNRNCPKCQQHDTNLWLDRQCEKLLPTCYYLITFTLPAQLRSLAYRHQKQIYNLMFACVEQTLKEFAAKAKNFGGDIGFTSVLHTASRKNDYHPHIHVLIPGGAVNKKMNLWKKKKTKYLFNPDHLSKVFGAKFRNSIYEQGFKFPTLPKNWVVDVRRVGSGEPTLKYLAKYLYRGPISEKQIISNKYGQVTFRYKDSVTKKTMYRTLSGADFLMLILKHVLPKGFRRSRDYGFLHPNAKKTLLKLQLFFHVKLKKKEDRQRSGFNCKQCGASMRIIRCGIKNRFKGKSLFQQREGPPTNKKAS